MATFAITSMMVRCPTVMGWEIRTHQMVPYPRVRTAYQVDVPLVNQYECSRVYGVVGSDAFCAGYRDGGYDSCQG
ncbi:trypsin-like serine protease [Vibrio lentus]|nr:trypsin-like serine protease [Vibrio lentus]